MQKVAIPIILMVFIGLAIVPSLSIAHAQVQNQTTSQKQSFLDRLNVFKNNLQQRFSKPTSTNNPVAGSQSGPNGQSSSAASPVPRVSILDRINTFKASFSKQNTAQTDNGQSNIAKTNLGQQVSSSIQTFKANNDPGKGSQFGQKLSDSIKNLKTSITGKIFSGKGSSSSGGKK